MVAMVNTALYQAVTLAECMQDPASLAWLIQSNCPLPERLPHGRYPTPMEIQSVLDSLPGIRVTYRITSVVWQSTIQSRKDVAWAILRVQGYDGDPDQPLPFSFEAGWDELILQVTARLVPLCGPFVLLHDSGAAPWVIL